jgi:hypothetical protein
MGWINDNCDLNVYPHVMITDGGSRSIQFPNAFTPNGGGGEKGLPAAIP